MSTELDRYGPAMGALSERHQQFINVLLAQGRMNYTAAYMEVWPDSSHAAAESSSSRLMSSPKLLDALHEEAAKRLRAGAALAVSVMQEIANDPTHKDRLKAAGMIADRVGFHAQSEHKVTVERPTDDVEIIQRIVDLGKSMDWTDAEIRAAIGNNAAMPAGLLAAPVVDVEYAEVTTGEEGLEDVL